MKRVEVTVFQKNDKCTISVSDYGIGIPLEKRKHIFIRYSEFKKSARGSGLGMVIIKTLIDKYRGEISIESRIQDDYTKGSRFKISLKCKSD